jgi:hypothetical protein
MLRGTQPIARPCLLAAFLLAACSEKPAAVTTTEPQAVASETAGQPAWTSLRGEWQQVTGGVVEEDGDVLRIGWGEALTAVKWAGDLPEPPFEIELDARRLDGSDFFCGLTFPVRNSGQCVTLIVGGWGGGVVGISSINGLDASENETTEITRFENGTWYAIRLRRDGERIEMWLDGQKLIDVDTEGRELALRPGPISVCEPFGLATWQSTGEIRNIRWRSLVD